MPPLLKRPTWEFTSSDGTGCCSSTQCSLQNQTANAPLHRRNQPAQKVVVTGSFDNWSKSESLDKVDDGFEKAVRIDNDSDKIYYKVSEILFLGAI